MPGAPSIYCVTVTNNGCSTSTCAALTPLFLPTLFTVTGGGVRCTTDETGPAVGLSGSQAGVNYQLFLDAAPVGDPVAGTGNAISFGPQLAVGTTYTVLATNANNCMATMTGSAEVSTIVCGLISDPCECLNNATTLTNGQFGEVIQINSGTGLVWTVTAVSGLYTTSSLPPPSTPTPIVVGATFTETPAGSGTYLLEGRHVDALGYTLSVRNGRGSIFTIGNSCSYPNPVITTNLDGPFCVNTDPILLTGDPW